MLVDGQKAFRWMLGAQEKCAVEKQDKESKKMEKVIWGKHFLFVFII